MFQYKSKINQSKGNENDLIKTISLRKTYGISKTPVLDSIDFVLKRGECTCIVRPNGSGKTTFLNIILGIIPKSSGKIILKGKIGFSPETSINFQWLSAYENIQYYRSISNSKVNVEEYMKFLNISETGRRQMKYFSKGMKRKIDIIRAILNEPDILVLDEPFEGLDPVTCNEITELLMKIKNSGKAILMSSHDLGYVERIADEVLFLENGRVTKIDQHKNLYRFIFKIEKIEDFKSKTNNMELLIEKTEELYIIYLYDAQQKNAILKELINCDADIIEQGFKTLEEEYVDKFKKTD